MSKRTLSEADRDRIYQLCEEDSHPQKKVAAFYGVSQSTISNTLRDKRYEAQIAEMKNGLYKAAASEALNRQSRPYIDTSSDIIDVSPTALLED